MRKYTLKNIEIGLVSGKLQITKDMGVEIQANGKNRRMCEAKCECGNKVVTRLDRIKYGEAKSCGCLQKIFTLSGKANFKHGDSYTRFHNIWSGMKKRTSTKAQKRKNYACYLRHNIKVSNDWEKYENFKKDMYEEYTKHVTEFGERNTTLDRIDGTKDYSKENCRWATYKEQANNTVKKIYGK